MEQRHRRSRASAILLVAGLAAGVLMASGCGTPNRHRIATGDLTQPAAADSTIELAPRIDVGATGGVAPRTPDAVVESGEARGGVGSIRVTPGAPDEALFVVTDEAGAAEDPAAGSGSRRGVLDQVMIDSVVGQINGRPVFASEFFEPLDARLSAEARTKSPKEWLEMAQTLIRGQLHAQVRDELLLAEFESSLTVEQRSGLLFFVSQIRDNLVSLSRGSEELLAQKLQEEEGLTIDEKVEAERRRAFIREQLRNELSDSAYVPWRDVVLQYRQDEGQYRPAPTARIRMIQVAGDDAEAALRVEEALDAGESFEAVAARESLFRPASGGLYEVELTGDRYEDSRVFGPDELNEAALGLAEGEHVGPITQASNGRRVWIMLESVEANVVSLYEAQFAIHEALRNQRLLEEEAKYFQGLIDRSSLSPIQEMEDRLLEIASTRYLINQAP